MLPVGQHQARALGLALAIAALALATVLAGRGVAAPHTIGWPQWGNTADNTHFAALSQIDAANVGRLRLAWKRSEGQAQSGWETFPVVVGRTMYYTTNTDQVLAVDATTGRMRWSFLPRVNLFAAPQAGPVEPASRGVAVGAGKVYDLTYDDQLIALDARTGRREWDVRIADPAKGYAETSPPAYWNGELIVGGPAGSAGLRGFVAAFDARDGNRLWRTPTIPRRGHGWVPAAGAHGGGDVWMPPVVDPATGTVYVGTGNPTPAFSARTRRGCDPSTDSVVAMNARTGRLKWAHALVCDDSWDYDTTQSPLLLDLHAGQRSVPAVGDASKRGFYSTLDARTGKLLARTPELVRYSRPHRVPTRHGVVVCPGNFGGLEYGPASFSPSTRHLYLTTVDMCMRFTVDSQATIGAHQSGAPDLEGDGIPVGRATGGIVSVDPASGRVVWRRKLPRPAAGGTLATAGGLVFAGDDDGRLYAFDARTGAVVWRHALGMRFGSAPIAYEVGGTEFVAVAAGGSQIPSRGGASLGGELFVFRLG